MPAMSPTKPTPIEHTIVPDHPLFPDLDWIRTYEISRACFTLRRNGKVKLPAVMDPSWNSCNPAEICNSVAQALKAGDSNLKASSPAQIEKNLRLELEKHLDDGMKFSESQRNIEYNVIINLEAEDKKTFLVPELCPPRFCKSTALNRTYGAEKFLVVTLSDKARRELESEPAKTSRHRSLFTKPWRIGNRIYHIFLRKNTRIYMVYLNPSEGWSAVAKFINGILDIPRNKELSKAKWVSRGALFVSSTLPTIDFRPENIRRVPDVMSNSLFVSPEFMNTIAESLGLTYLPSTIRGRVGGSTDEFVWRLGRIPLISEQDSSEQDSPLIQLWEDHPIDGKTVWFKFKAFRYDRLDQEFKVEEESMGVPLGFCQVVSGKIGKAEIMTDGAAALSRVAALQISTANGVRSEILPSVYQGRIGFAKGLWYLDPNSSPLDNTIWIEIRDSQWKAEPQAGFCYHFNLCRYSVSVNTTTLGIQNLPVLASRKIPNSVFEELAKEALKNCVSAFETSDPMELMQALSNEGAVSSYRIRTLLTHSSNSGIDHNPAINRTFGKTTTPNNRISDQTSDRLQQFSLQPNENEQLLCMLQAGFPVSNRLVVEKLRKVKVEKLIKMRRLSIPLSLSCYVYAIPDPTGTLQKGEVFLQFSSFRDSTGTRHGILAGPALIWRSPCAAPIDIQKVQMVANENLQRLYFDVIVCSTRGNRAVLSLLSGGDYDGDQVCVTWDKRLVNPFQNADPDAYPEHQEEEWFDCKLAGAIGDSLLGPLARDPERFVKTAQGILIDELFTPSSFAAYSGHYETCDYILGSEHHLTLTMGWIYVTCLDAAKKGLVLKPTKDSEIVTQYKNELIRLNVPLDKNGNVLTPFFQRNLARNEKKCIITYRRPQSITLVPYVLEVIYETVTAAFDQFTQINKEYDDVTHGRRAGDTDADLRRLFIHQKKIFDKPHPKPLDLAEWADAGVWNGVLKQMQREIADLQKEHAKMVGKIISQKDADQALQEEEHYVPAMGNNRMLFMKPILTKYHLELSWENAYKTSKAEAEFFKCSGPVSEEEMNAFQRGKEGYLDGLGPDGYALLKASCAASNSNAEGYFPFEVAFREICYLKAQASVKNSYGNSGLRLSGIQQESLPPWTLDSISYYAMLSKRMLYSKRAAATPEV